MPSVCSVVALVLHVSVIVALLIVITIHLVPPEDDTKLLLSGSMEHGWELPQELAGDVAVVGNGPVSEEQLRELRDNYPTVIGMNNVANRNIRITHLMSRQDFAMRLHGFLSSVFSPKRLHFVGHPDVFNRNLTVIVCAQKFFGFGFWIAKDPTKKVHVMDIGRETRLNTKFSLGDHATRLKGMPSTGLLGIRLALQNSSGSVHVYGMNWNFVEHDAAKEKKWITDHPRVVIHPTPSSKHYDGLNK